MNFIGDLFWRYAKEMRLSFGGIVGVPNGGKPFAKAMVIEAYKQDGVAYPFVDLVKVRDDFGKEHVGKIIDTDDFSPARPALAVEDAITKATRLLETVFFFRGEGYQIYDALVFLDRQEGGQRRLSDVGVNLYSILTMGMVVEFYFEEGFIKDPEYRAIREYREHVRKYQKQVRA
ncbi:MAG TPA: hypothetical protein VJZ94_00450 [Candidatus Paceibacterota bacterium]|nr:hypothetical protein [Candidatus Paceibacterota bacterium]